MNAPFCNDVQLWLTSLDDTAVPSPPPPALCAHVSGCARCRGTLLVLAAELLHAPLEAEQTTCDQCLDDLAAYIDIERDEGITEACSAYPDVWWHLWNCPDCAQMYAMIAAIQDAEATGTLSPLPLRSLVPHQQRPMIQISLPRALFVRALTPHYGVAWGVGDEGTVIHDEEDDGYEVRASVRRRGGQWIVVITVDPPVVGDAVIRLGTTVFRAPLGPDGAASVGPIPAALLTLPTGPDMDITIEPATS